MKKFILLLIVPFLIFCQNNDLIQSKGAEVEFHSKKWNFGEIKEGEIIQPFFTFENIGTKPLIIINAKPSCGCIVPKWSKEPILPGEHGYIQATFKSQGKPGLCNRPITLTMNSFPNTHKLRIVGRVIPF